MTHVIFGTGPLGQSVMRELVKRGQRVRMVNRSGRADVPNSVDVVAADAYNTDQARTVCEGASVVYQCAQPPYTQWPEKFPALQASIMGGASTNGAKFIAGDNLYMYGDVDGPIHEGLPYAATTRKGRTRAIMAETVLEAHRRGELRTALARGSDFFGPGVLGSLLGERVFAPLIQGKPAQTVGNFSLPHTYTFIDDFGKAVVILGEHDEALGQAWHVPNPPTVSTQEIVEMAAAQLGIEPKIATTGPLMMRIGGLFIPEARETVEMMYEFQKPFVVDHSKFTAAFGDHATPLAEAIQQTLAWYQQRAQSAA